MCGCARFSRQTGSLARGLTALGWTAKGFCSLAFIFVFLLSGERKTPKKNLPVIVRQWVIAPLEG